MKKFSLLLFLMAFLPLCAMNPDDLQSTISIKITQFPDGTKVVHMMLPDALQAMLAEKGITLDHLAQLGTILQASREPVATLEAPFKLLEQVEKSENPPVQEDRQ